MCWPSRGRSPARTEARWLTPATSQPLLDFCIQVADTYSAAKTQPAPGATALTVAVIGIAIAYVLHVADPRLPVRLASQFRALYLFLLNKWYFDELYDWLFVRQAVMIGDGLWKSGDGAVIDGLGPDGVAAVTRDLARQASRLQTGYLYHYAFAMMIGLVALVTWYLLPR